MRKHVAPALDHPGLQGLDRGAPLAFHSRSGKGSVWDSNLEVGGTKRSEGDLVWSFGSLPYGRQGNFWTRKK